MRARTLIAIMSVLAAALLTALPAAAQASRTWVSGVGDDVNPCSRTAPCKTFAGAIAKTAAGGQINVLDSGGFGAVTIKKSISIVVRGAEGGVLVSGPVNGILIDAGPTDTVHLEGLSFEGMGTGTSGVRILSAGSVHIRKCLIRGFMGAFPGSGIAVETTVSTRVFVADCAITKNNTGILVKPAGAGTAEVFVTGVHVENNATAGLVTEGKAALIRLHNSIVTGNGLGLVAADGGRIVSLGNNAIVGNTRSDGSPTESLSLAQTAPPGWIADARTGCHVWNDVPRPKETVTWSGGCSNRFAEGKGVLQWFVDGKPGQRYEGEYRYGRLNGRGVLHYGATTEHVSIRYEGEFRDGQESGRGVETWADGRRYEGEYRAGSPHGSGVFRRADGTTLTGTWTNGCGRQGEHSQAVGPTPKTCGFE
jgi:hypothetical protein